MTFLRYGQIKRRIGAKFPITKLLCSGTRKSAPVRDMDRCADESNLEGGCRSFFDAGLAESLVGHDLIRKPVPTFRDHAVRADTGSGRSRTARADAATCSGWRIPRSRCRRPAPRS